MRVSIQTNATLTCPHCAHAAQHEMPTDACQFFHTCEACQTLLSPLPGDCCVLANRT
jgi:hypothetical protein